MFGVLPAYVVVCEHHALIDLLNAAVLLLKPLSILLDHLPEDGPLHTTDQASLPPPIRRRLDGCVATLEDLLIKPRNDLLAAVHPLVPVLPDKWTSIALRSEKLNTFVELSHALGDLLRCLGLAQLFEAERLCMQELLKATVFESAEQTRADAFTSETL